ncbi:MAG: hypothetical protein AB7V56_04555 [Candidatus Nitrosocosmicus sp.]
MDKIQKPEGGKPNGLFQDKIARLLIFGAFILVGIMLAIHIYSSNFIFDKWSSNSNDTTTRATLDLFREVSSANNNIFNIILALLGAWVGAVLAFYFGSQSIDRAYASLSQVQQSLGNFVAGSNLSSMTVKDLITKNSETTRINKFKMSSKINEISKTAADIYPFVTIVDDSEKNVLGLLFISQLTAVKPKSELDNLDQTLNDFLSTNPIDDFITKTKWTADGVKNYATVNMSDSLSKVIEAMNDISPSLSVRAVVVENGEAKAIIGHEIINREMYK